MIRAMNGRHFLNDHFEFLHTNSETNDNEGIQEDVRLGWPENYYDSDEKRAILQVNSHQLDSTGTRLKKSPRFAQPTPNLAIASANHHADVGADLALKMTPSESDTAKTISSFHIPPSSLTYFLTLEGIALDRHVSDHIRKAFDNERIKRIKSKPTQGLLWRILPLTTTSWSVIRLHPGLHRSLLGLSSTHTRCMYKSIPYRTGCLMDYMEKIHDKEQIEAITCSSIQDQISMLSACPMCNQREMQDHKGNRRHAFLTCQHTELARFKEKMNNMMGNRMYLFIQEFKEVMQWDQIEYLMEEINAAFLLLQSEQTGRLKHLPIESNNTYLPIKEILRKHDVNSLFEAIHQLPSEFFSHLLGITPESPTRISKDDEIGLIDGPWLGLLPKSIDKLIKTKIKKEFRYIADKEAATNWETRIQQSWREIKALILGRAAGIHKIITSIFHQRESDLVKKHDLQHLVKEVFQKKRKRKMNSTENNICIHTPNKKLKTSPMYTKNCDGITCGNEAKRWCPDSKFQINKIPIGRKQCQRCSMFCTAMNVTSDLLNHISENNESQISNFIKQTLKATKKIRIPYSSLMDLLKASAPDNKHFVKAKYISKNRPNEKWKRICRIATVAIQHSKRCNPTQSPANLLQITTKSIETALLKRTQAIQFNKTNLQKYLQDVTQPKIISERKIAKVDSPQSTTTVVCTDTEIKPLPANTPKIGKPDDVIDLCSSASLSMASTPESVRIRNNKETALKEQLDLMDQASWMTGAQLTYIIDVLRIESIGQDVYIANTQASHIINTWEPNHGWQRFARIFNNHRVTHRKPNGLYLIPIFEGEVSRGHWYLIVVDKSTRGKKGFVIDSLGSGSTTSTIIQKISDAFIPGRGHAITWSSPTSIPQQGCECGSRTACAMETLCIGKRTSIEIQESIQAATLSINISASTYDQMTYRRRAACLIGKHTRFRSTV